LPASETSLPLRIGARTLITLRRRLVRRRLSLEEGLAGGVPALPPLDEDGDGYLVTALPASLAAGLTERHAGLKPFVRQSYRRSYARLDQDFDAYLGGFSAKSRSTCKRKLRKFAERSGGAIDVRRYRTEQEIGHFYDHARAVSAKTYQERLLDAGLPEGEGAQEEMRRLARADRARGWLLFLDGAPIAYLWAPAEGFTLIYAHLGHDPDFADLSPGTVLQLEAMRQLMDERAFRLFDFTEGEGQHKRQFATGGVDCVDLLLVRPTFGNLAAGYALGGFDSAVAVAKSAVSALGLSRALRRLRR
jgi:CelD/BcsL family acetyltransferase involved in cellulose biosynthesis